jgi:hypothetical protein
MTTTTTRITLMLCIAIPVIASDLGGCATAPMTAQEQARCGPRPTQDEIASSVQAYISHVNWKDPDSVHVQNVRMHECRFMWNGLINGGGHTVGWEIDFDLNAKNSYGGYTGFQLKSIIRTADGLIHWDPTE